ncbi:MAG: DNA-directed RNA polymerase subunit L [Thermoplasmata archaeon]|nr:MAG: DNA-directed RNA polymerase subunit L [Thermoplasmata archaeon]
MGILAAPGRVSLTKDLKWKSPSGYDTMEIKIIKDRANELEIEIIGEDSTILNPIKEKLLEREKVVYAEYSIEHPILSNPKLYIKTKDARPKDELKAALKELQKESKSFRQQVEKL